MKSSGTKRSLTSYDDPFQTEDSRQEDRQERVIEVPLDRLQHFHDHLFKCDTTKPCRIWRTASGSTAYCPSVLRVLWLAPSGLSPKDFIAPIDFEFREGRTFRMGSKYGAVSFLQLLAPKLQDRILADFLDLESSVVVSMRVQSIEQMAASNPISRFRQKQIIRKQYAAAHGGKP